MDDRDLNTAAQRFGTPLYVYDVDEIIERYRTLKDKFENRFGISFAVKSNPNIALMKEVRPEVVTFDVSSFAEFERAIAAGCPAEKITFSGPAKRAREIELAVSLGLGELVAESIAEAELASKYATRRGRTQNVLLRINPEKGPREFGSSMSGKPSQFGVDEEVMGDAIARIIDLPGLSLEGFHIYSATNSLSETAIIANFANFIRIFRAAAEIAGIRPRKLVFGSGFGVPYLPSDTSLDIDELAAGINPMIDEFKSDPVFADAELALEMGRWLIGPAGWLLSSVIAEKSSRGTDFRLCDAGFNNHLAACSMMGTIIRRNWRIRNISTPDGAPQDYTLTGPLCTTIDQLATDIELPALTVGDVICVDNSGAYGLTSSPTRFISHPEPREVMARGGKFEEITESQLNHWTSKV